MEELIKRAKDAYYNSGTPIMSDAEYDKLIKKVGAESVGAPITGDIDRIKIIGKSMKSLEKVHKAEEIIDFFDDLSDIVCSIKADGLSTRIIYEDGILISANTRGNGEIGGDITEHVKYINGIPLEISKKGRYIVDGESVILKSDFDNLNGIIKNQRNGAAGALSTKNIEYVKKYHLTFLAWDIIEGGSTNNYNENLEEARLLGFKINPWLTFDKNKNIDEINTNILDIASHKGIPCDGVVWRMNNIAEGELRGETTHHFKNACAWKKQEEEVETKLIDIEWSMGKDVITPVAIYEEIELLDSKCSRASLHNISVLKDTFHGIPFIGQKIKICKKNEIIPQITWAEENNSISNTYLLIPNSCPICNSFAEQVESESGTINLICTNKNCEGKLLQRLTHYCSRDKGMDIRGLSSKTIEKLIDLEWINNIKDIYSLNKYKSEWCKMAGFGEKSVSNILNAIEESKKCTLEIFISSLSIPLIGKTYSKQLAKHYHDWKTFRLAIENNEDFSLLDGFGYEMNKSLHSFNYEEADKIAEILNFKQDITISKEDKVEKVTGSIFCITGKLSKARNLIQTDIEASGGKVGNSVTSKTNYLVCNKPEASTKYKAALEKGLPIITEEELYKML